MTAVVVLVTKLCPTLCDTMDYSLPGSSVMGFPRQEDWSGLPFPSPEYLPNPGIKPISPALIGKIFTIEPPGRPEECWYICFNRQSAWLSSVHRFHPIFCKYSSSVSSVFTCFSVLFRSASCVYSPVVSLGPGKRYSISSVLEVFGSLIKIQPMLQVSCWEKQLHKVVYEYLDSSSICKGLFIGDLPQAWWIWSLSQPSAPGFTAVL